MRPSSLEWHWNHLVRTMQRPRKPIDRKLDLAIWLAGVAVTWLAAIGCCGAAVTGLYRVLFQMLFDEGVAFGIVSISVGAKVHGTGGKKKKRKAAKKKWTAIRWKPDEFQERATGYRVLPSFFFGGGGGGGRDKRLGEFLENGRRGCFFLFILRQKKRLWEKKKKRSLVLLALPLENERNNSDALPLFWLFDPVDETGSFDLFHKTRLQQT